MAKQLRCQVVIRKSDKQLGFLYLFFQAVLIFFLPCFDSLTLPLLGVKEGRRSLLFFPFSVKWYCCDRSLTRSGHGKNENPEIHFREGPGIFWAGFQLSRNDLFEFQGVSWSWGFAPASNGNRIWRGDWPERVFMWSVYRVPHGDRNEDGENRGSRSKPKGKHLYEILSVLGSIRKGIWELWMLCPHRMPPG
jgi:hypothetical protein